MQTVTINPRWRAQLEGDPLAIADLERVLNGHIAGADSYVLRMEGDVGMLTTTRWDTLPNTAQALEAAQAALRLFTGALNVFDVCAPPSIGTIFEVKSDGSVQQSRTSPLQFYIMKAAADRITPSDFSRVMFLSGQHEWLASALVEMSGQIDWFSLYRTIEAIEAHVGGEKAMSARQEIGGPALKRAKQMANSVRHLQDGKHLPPRPPVKFDEACTTVRDALAILINALP